MADRAPHPAPQTNGTKSVDGHESKPAVTEEQVRAIADRVYRMLLRDLQHERERDRSSIWHSRTFGRG
jgi:hypothetical protein